MGVDLEAWDFLWKLLDTLEETYDFYVQPGAAGYLTYSLPK